MSKSPIEYLKHIMDEISFLEKESAGYTEDQFMRDDLKQRAFARYTTPMFLDSRVRSKLYGSYTTTAAPAGL